MELWKPLRTSHSGDEFADSLAAIGLEFEQWDRIAPGIDDVLCGVTLEKLDIEYPVRFEDYRVYLTANTRGVPALRIAFRLRPDGQICYEAVDLRDDETL